MSVCALCHAPLTEPGVLPVRDRRYLLCRVCGSGALEPADASAESFDEGYFIDGGARAGYTDYEADEAWHRRTARTRLRRVSSALVTGPRHRIIEIGTAAGYFCDEARRLGWEASAVEVSDWATVKTRARGFRVEESLAAYRGSEPVDAIACFQVLEHVPDVDATLADAAALLRPGGVFVCETWDVASRTARLAGRRWQQLSPPSVLWLFSRTGIEAAAARAGLALTAWRPTPKVVSLATVLGQSLPGGRLGAGLRTVGARVGVPYVFDDLVTFVLVRSS